MTETFTLSEAILLVIFNAGALALLMFLMIVNAGVMEKRNNRND